MLILLLIPVSFALNETDCDVSTQYDEGIDENSIELSPNDNSSSYGNREYYFNSSHSGSGDGSINNPYNKLTVNRIKDHSTIYLADGEYLLNKGKTLDEVTFIGETPEKTIIKYVGDDNTGVFEINPESYLSLRNVTLIGFNLNLNGGTIESTNTIFKNTISSLIEVNSSNVVHSGSVSFGGVIYADFAEDDEYIYYPNVFLDNCTFINNTAKYGGAIYMTQGLLEISNSRFFNNSAYSYGGAIAALYDTEVYINNSCFISDKSYKNAGGAIYLLDSFLSSYNMTIANCSATFGGAITSLRSKTILDYFNAVNNSAIYDGGVIYQMYNDVSITNSRFINNAANNGGAIFVDGVETFELEYNTFEKNQAISIAGAVYSLLTEQFSEYDNGYYGNKANITNDLYQCDKFIPNLNNGNYTLIYTNYTSYDNLPKRYSLIDENLVTPVKDQENGGNCWAFASIAALESAILKASGLSLDLSEDNMKNLMALFSDYGWNSETNDGGFDDMAIGYLTSWLGPVFEASDEYDDFGMLSPLFDSFTHVQNIVFLSRNNFTDNDAIKRAILSYGAVVSGIYFDDECFDESSNSYYYNSKGSSTNHAVAIVGWDDNYSRFNFIETPSKNGAWIVKNSWDVDWGDNGYFYVSYYDSSVARKDYPDDCYVFVFNDSEIYDKNYQYDIIGKTDYYTSDYKTVWVENIFESTDDELLSAVSTYFRKTTDFELSIYLNEELVLCKNGTCNPGYTTINLGNYIALKSGDIFKVVFKLTCEGKAEFAISENNYANKLFYMPGVSFYSNDGVKWKDLYSAKIWYDSLGPQVAAIKAFSKSYDSQPIINYTISVYHNTINIKANVSDLNDDIIYSGDVVINIDGNDYFVNLVRGSINFTHVFESVGNHAINISYNNHWTNTSVDIEKLDIDLNSNVNILNDKLVIDLESSYKISLPLKVMVNNVTYDAALKKGKCSLVLNDADDYYDIRTWVDDEKYVCEFSLKVYKSKIIASDFISNYNLENSYSIELKDCFNKPLANRIVSFVIEDKTYFETTDDNGLAEIYIKLQNRNTQSLKIMFEGDENYFGFNATVNVKVKSTIMFLSSTYVANTNYNVMLFDENDNPLPETQFKVLINGKTYWYVTDGNGKISIPLNFALGSYKIEVYNHVTGEESSQSINIIPRIVENKDLTVYYLSNSVYTIRINGDNGIPVAGELVKITIDKKNYYVRTDNLGYAHFKISLKPNSYRITASYKEARVSNKIVVKPLLTAKNISKKKSKKIKFQAKLVNTKGKPVKGKKITFKIKGKTYTAKTNAKGIAKIYIKNLKVGKYKIITKYGKSKITNTIKIKR